MALTQVTVVYEETTLKDTKFTIDMDDFRAWAGDDEVTPSLVKEYINSSSDPYKDLTGQPSDGLVDFRIQSVEF